MVLNDKGRLNPINSRCPYPPHHEVCPPPSLLSSLQSTSIGSPIPSPQLSQPLHKNRDLMELDVICLLMVHHAKSPHNLSLRYILNRRAIRQNPGVSHGKVSDGKMNTHPSPPSAISLLGKSRTTNTHQVSRCFVNNPWPTLLKVLKTLIGSTGSNFPC